MMMATGHGPLSRDSFSDHGPVVIIVTYTTDRDMVSVSRSLTRSGVTNLLWFLDARDQEVFVDARPTYFEILRAGSKLSSALIQTARIMLYRSRLGSSRPIVTASSGTQQERSFAEREWTTLLTGLFLEAEDRYPAPIWVNKPSVAHLTSGKYHLISTADLDGFEVPRLRVSTEARLPESDTARYVCKAINEDESIDEERTYPTTALDDDVVGHSPFRTDCPSLIQERVDSCSELRVYYLLGQLLSLNVTFDPSKHVDVRMAPRQTLDIQRVETPPELAVVIERYCTRRGLSYCVFDFLTIDKSRHLLVDVTPAGTWSHYESADDPFITDWYVATVRDLAG